MKYLKLFEEFTTKLNIKKIMDNYLECAIWTEEDTLKGDEESQISGKYSEDSELKDLEERTWLNIHNFTDDSIIKAYEDIKKFLEYAGDAVNDIDEEQLGHDIWLTRNHHGAGFFDRSYDYDNEKKLIDAAHALKEVDLFINDDMKLSFSNENLDESIKKNKMKKEKNNLNEIRNSIRKIIQESYEEQAWKDMDFIIKNKWNSTAKSVSGDQIDEWMKYANKELHGYGIEPIRKEGAYVDKYYYDIVGLYVNMGDTYDKTIVFDTENRQFLITSYGDFVEKLDSEEQEIPDEDNSEDF